MNMKLFVGMNENGNAVDSKTILNQIEEMKKYQFDIYNFDKEKVEFEDLYNENKNSLIRHIYLDRIMRIDKNIPMADRPSFIVYEVKNRRIIRLEFYEGHNQLKLKYDFRVLTDLDKTLQPYLKEDEYKYNPVEFLESMGLESEIAKKAMELFYEDEESRLTMEDIRTRKKISPKIISEKLGCSERSYNNKEKGRTQFSVKEFVILCEIFEKSPNQMLEILQKNI